MLELAVLGSYAHKSQTANGSLYFDYSDADNGCLTLSNKKLISNSNEYSSVRFNTSYYSPAGVSTTTSWPSARFLYS